ncbi:hydrophobic surface binding protein A domain-containing protein [Trichoderma evansii]
MVAIAKLIFLASATATAATTQLLQRDVDTVIRDLEENLGPHIAALDNDVHAFPRSGIAGALSINSDAEALVSIVKGATANVQSAGKFDEAGGADVIANIEALVPQTLGTLDKIAQQATDWQNVPGGQKLVRTRLEALKEAFDKYIDAVIEAEPVLQKQVTTIKAHLTETFNTAIGKYPEF